MATGAVALQVIRYPSTPPRSTRGYAFKTANLIRHDIDEDFLSSGRGLQLVKTKSIIYSAVILIGAVWMYRFLNSGGWLTHHYQLSQLNDPDSLNLIPVIFEPIAVLGVVAYWVWRTRKLYRLLFFLFLGQLLIGASYLAVFLLFVLTYKPRMM